MPPGLLISAPASGTGKTTLTLGLLKAFCQDGLTVQAFKCGPDYIDPAFHRAASGRPSFNLDSWAMSADRIAAIAGQAAGADLVLAEGAMGLFDGVAQKGAAGTGAAADIAAMMGWTVIVILDVSGQAQSAGAVALGFARMRRDIDVAGVVLNRVASPRHEAMARAGCVAAGLPVLGALPCNPEIAVPERHLGLVQAEEQADLPEILERAAAFVRRNVDLEALRAIASVKPSESAQPAAPQTPPPGQRIALARDAAFSFVYPHLLQGWRAAGAEILPFSPLADEAPDDSADICWLPGGYPELHAGRLAAAETFRSGLGGFAKTRPVHGECGGYIAMGTSLTDKSGTTHRMAGLLGLETSFAKRKMHLGYRRATLAQPMPGYPAGSALCGHEFHYVSILAQPDEALARVTDATGRDVAETGSRRGLATGSFFHLIGPAETRS